MAQPDATPEPLPPYAYVPGGPWPHPRSDPAGHSAGRPVPAAAAMADGRWQASAAYLRGVELFNAGYYWEAHEAWESLWHAHGRAGPVADLLRGLIKLAAAGVKVREGQPHGVTTHAARAGELFRAVRRQAGRRLLGLDLEALIALAGQVAAQPPANPVPAGTPVARVFGFVLRPEEDRPAPGSRDE